MKGYYIYMGKTRLSVRPYLDHSEALREANELILKANQLKKKDGVTRDTIYVVSRPIIKREG